MAFEDELKKRWTPYGTQTIDSGGNVQSGPLSPEAQSTMRAGGGGGGSGDGDIPVPGTGGPEPRPPELNPVRETGNFNELLAGRMAGGASGSANVPNPATVGHAPSAAPSKVPLPLYGNSPQQQATMLNNYFNSIGVPLPAFAVGGTSPFDAELNYLIDMINGASSETARKMYAEQFAGFVAQRNASVQNPLFTFGQKPPATGAPPPPGAPPPGGATRTPGELTSALWPSAGTPPGLTPTVPPANAAILQQLIQLMSQGGVTDEMKATQEGQLVTDLERSSRSRRQLLADRLGGQGVTGGVAIDALQGVGNETDAARSSGLAQIRTGILQLQNQARTQALGAILQQMGMASTEAMQIAGMITQRQIAQAQLANNSEQFGQNLGLQTLGLQQQGQSSKMNFVIALMQLENQVDEQTRAYIQRLIDGFLTGGTS